MDLSQFTAIDSANDIASPMTLAESIAVNGPKSIQGMVRCAQEIQGKPLKEALEIELEIYLFLRAFNFSRVTSSLRRR